MSYWAPRKDLSGGKETILFVHGAGGGQLSWSFQKGFFEKDFYPILLDLPGHGESGGHGEDDIGRYAEHVHSLIRALRLPKLFLVGHSMGGAIAQTLALSRPDALKGIVLAGTGAKLKVLAAVLTGIKNDFENTVRNIVQFAFSRRVSAELIERGTTQLLKCPPEVLYGDFLACDRFDLLKEVEKIDLPTLIISGEEDGMTPVKYSEYLHRQIRDSRIEILPGAGHMVMMESPEAFNRTLKEFGSV